jgi:hypothetical protein
MADYIIAPVYGNIYRNLRPKDITSDQTDRQREAEQIAVLLKILYSTWTQTLKKETECVPWTGYRTVLSRFDRTVFALQNLEFYVRVTNNVNKQNDHTSLPPPAVFMDLEIESKYDQEQNFKTQWDELPIICYTLS